MDRRTYLETVRVGAHNLLALLVFTGCSSGSDVVEPGERFGTLDVVITTAGPNPDADGYLLALDHGAPQAVSQGAAVTFSDLPEGDHDLELGGVAANCSTGAPNPRTVRVVAGSTEETTFQVTCTRLPAQTAAIRVSTTTSGTPRHFTGSTDYELYIDDSFTTFIGSTDTEIFSNLAPGPHTVFLLVDAPNCVMEGASSRRVSVEAAETIAVDFFVTCFETAPPPPPGSLSGRIAFQSDREGNYDVYVMNADGTGVVRLTTHSADDGSAMWSPDGSKIAFQSRRDGNSEIYIINTDATGETRLTNHQADDGDPVWSPDGSKIAFLSQRDGNSEVYVMNADGSGQTRLTTHPDEDGRPAWSPDGRRIAWSTRDNAIDIYVMNSDGSDVVNLTNDPAALDENPQWSPDGTRIAFNSERDGGSDVYVIDSHGGDQVNLTNDPGFDVTPAWSPDGRSIAFASERGGLLDVYLMEADGSNQRNLTNNPAVDAGPEWSPDGTSILFLTDRDGVREIYVVNADGSSVFNLTHNDPEAFDGGASWHE